MPSNTSSSLAPEDNEEDKPDDPYEAHLNLDFSKLKLKDINQNYGYGQHDDLESGTFVEEEQNGTVALLSDQGSYPGEEGNSSFPNDKYILVNTEESTHQSGGSKKHSAPQTNKTLKEAKSHSHKSSRRYCSSFPRDVRKPLPLKFRHKLQTDRRVWNIGVRCNDLPLELCGCVGNTGESLGR